MRIVKSLFLFSVYDDIANAVQFGTLDINSVQINSSAVQFVNGKVPISSKTI